MAKSVTRRRAIGIFAAAAGLPLAYTRTSFGATTTAFEWSGQALGAPAKLILNDHDGVRAQRLIDTIVAEVARLERIFSLYCEESSIVELNRIGAIAAPPPELLSLLSACANFWEATDGVFDPTIQPLWKLYRDHLGSGNAGERGPDAAMLNACFKRVGFDAVRFGFGRVAFDRPGMALTLNGVAQGFITDRVVDILRDAGISSSLIDMGEERAIGSRPDGTPWRVGLAVEQDSEEPDTVLPIVNRAVATSSQSGFTFDADGQFGHILHPRAGAVPALYRRVSVVAADATTADALSTAFNLMKVDTVKAVLDKFPAVAVDMVDVSGTRWQLGRT